MSETNSTFFLFNFFSILILSAAIDTLEPTQQIRDGEFLVLSGENFRLGFFSPRNSRNRFVGIWFNKVSVLTAFWVANRQTPLTDSSGVLTVANRGLTVLDGNGTVIWSSGSNSTESSWNLVAQLLDYGNLIIRERNQTNYTWQSFDHPTNTLIAGMKLGRNNVTGVERHLSSWTSGDNPSVGNYTFEIDTRGFPQLVVKRDSVKVYRGGPWNGLRFNGGSTLRPNPYYSYIFVFDQEEAYYSYEMKDGNVKMMLLMSLNGEVQRLIWSDRNQEWSVYLKVQVDNCANYASCGANGKCNINNSPECGCLEKFEPRNSNGADWSNGCIRTKPLDCQKGDGFAMYKNIKFPDTSDSWYDRSMSLEECRMVCLRNCSCMAYARLDIRTRTGCLIWFGNLIDIRYQIAESLQEIYIRLASSEVVGSSKMKWIIYAVSFALLIGIILLGLSVVLYFRKKNKKKKKKREREEANEEDLELPVFHICSITTATDNFSSTNTIGTGGFGSVYKGKLPSGQEIAVKRLSKNSSQGVNEFKNEIIMISKLQHRNLVKLLGCCIEGEERMLIYEYMLNKSLDHLIFDHDSRVLLTWQTRFEIALGIAKGLLYLHQDSRLRIIHRDLKASNILIDSELNPKISDFGIARIFGGDQIEAKTNRVIGTYGYMSPEYAIDGKFAVKSDVFSFGVLMIELISGTKNTRFRSPNHHHNLLGHTWMLWKDGKALDLVDPCLEDSYVESQVLRYIQISLLCVQKFPKDRPAMSLVVSMLGNEGLDLAEPKEPGFFIERSSEEIDTSNDERSFHSESVVTITMPEGR